MFGEGGVVLLRCEKKVGPGISTRPSQSRQLSAMNPCANLALLFVSFGGTGDCEGGDSG